LQPAQTQAAAQQQPAASVQTVPQPVQNSETAQQTQSPQNITPQNTAPQNTQQTTPQSAQTFQPAQTTPSAPPQPAAQTINQETQIPQNLLFKLADSTPQTIERYFNNLREILQQVQQELAGRETPDTARVSQEARSLETQIDFAAQVKNQIFVQLPLFHDGQQTLTNLHVYKDAKKSAAGSDDSTALIALETAALGHFETYVRKNSRAIQCQFRLESDAIVSLVRDNIHKLDALLREHNYSLEHFSFLPPGEPYTILSKPDENPVQNINEEMPHFDKRV
jgi:hypothetical protein